MKRILVLLVTLLAVPASAQPGATEPVDSFLARRVPEELAAEGTVLSRQGLALKVEQVGDRLLVSIVDVATARVAASTTVDSVPADREAAVAAVTHVAADLVTQIAGRAAAAPAPPAPPPVDVREELRHDAALELEFKRKAIRFGNDYEISVSKYGGSVHRLWVAYQGELDQRLDPDAFYGELGRADLAEAYHQRRAIMIGGYVAGVAAMGVAAYFMVQAAGVHMDDCSVSLPFDQFQACTDAAEQRASDQRRSYMTPALISMGVSLVGIGVGVWYHYHPHPISENEAKSMADAYNQGLRRQLGLPTLSTREPRVHDVRIAPYATGSGGGLVLGARF